MAGDDTFKVTDRSMRMADWTFTPTADYHGRRRHPAAEFFHRSDGTDSTIIGTANDTIGCPKNNQFPVYTLSGHPGQRWPGYRTLPSTVGY